MKPRTSQDTVPPRFHDSMFGGQVSAFSVHPLFALLLCLLLAGPAQLRAADGVSEYHVKAAFLAKFPEFVKWPAPGATITVGVLGDDPFGNVLEQMIKVRRAKRVEELKGCQIIFIARSERGNVGAILAALAGTGVLTVGETEDFVKQGGIIGFTMEGERVRFEINSGAARRGGLEISSRLLKLATKVTGP